MADENESRRVIMSDDHAVNLLSDLMILLTETIGREEENQ